MILEDGPAAYPERTTRKRMETELVPLIYADARLGPAFGLVLSLGLVLASAWFLLRPWPPGRRRIAWLLALALPSAAVVIPFMKHREVRIIPAEKQVVETRQAWVRSERNSWSFGQISQVTVQAGADEGAFTLGLQAGEQSIALDHFNDALDAEAQARRLARIGGWSAERRDYALRIAATGGDSQLFITDAGQEGVIVSLDQLVRVERANGERSPITP
jgi:hypothetical protein